MQPTDILVNEKEYTITIPPDSDAGWINNTTYADDNRGVSFNPFIILCDGRPFHFLNPTVDEIDSHAIAHGLSCINRFNGQTARPYSVATHSHNVFYYVRVWMYHSPKYQHLHWKVKREIELAALLHDAHEALWGFGDITSPAKQLIRHITDPIAERIDAVIAEKYDFPVEYFHHELVLKADLQALSDEMHGLMKPCEKLFLVDAPNPQSAPEYQSHHDAYAIFIQEFDDIQQRRNPNWTPTKNYLNNFYAIDAITNRPDVVAMAKEL